MTGARPEPRLSRRELDRLAVLRVSALAYPDREKVEVFRSDVLDLLAVVDRLMVEPRVQTLNVFQSPTSAFLAGSMTVYQRGGRR